MENSTFSRNGNNLATCDQPQELFQTEHAGDLGTVNTKIRRVIHVKLSKLSGQPNRDQPHHSNPNNLASQLHQRGHSGVF